MTSSSSQRVAIAGCGPSGCFLISLLRQSHAKARLIAIDGDEGSLDASAADQKIRARPGEKPAVEACPADLALALFDPSEEGSSEYAEAFAMQASKAGAYVYGIAVNKPGNAIDEAGVRSKFGGLAIIDAAWVLEKRADADEERALQIAFNFTVHVLTFLAGAIATGELETPLFRSATAGLTSGFAASHVSDAASIYALTMTRIDRTAIKSGIVFLPAETDDVLARRVFLGIARDLPREAALSMLRVNGLEPFKILAMLAH